MKSLVKCEADMASLQSEILGKVSDLYVFAQKAFFCINYNIGLNYEHQAMNSFARNVLKNSFSWQPA